MNQIISGLVFFAILLWGGIDVATTYADPLDQETEERLANQQKRIEDGREAKQLTEREAEQLKQNLKRIREQAERFQADGKLTQEERAQLDQMIDQSNQMIREKRHQAAEGAGKAGTAAKTVTPAPPDEKIKQEIADQQKRINEGLKSQELTLNESRILEGNLAKIREEDSRSRADGELEKEEKADLLDMLDDNNKMIKDKKNNPVKDIMEHVKFREHSRTIPERIARQQKRINSGIKTRELTSEESKVLLANLNYIKKEEDRLQGSQKLTPQEKNRLHALLDQNSAMIGNKKHNPVKAVK